MDSASIDVQIAANPETSGTTGASNGSWDRAAGYTAQCNLDLWGGTPVPQPTPSSVSPDLVDCTSSRARAPGAAQGSRPTKTVDLGKLSDIGLYRGGTDFSLC